MQKSPKRVMNTYMNFYANQNRCVLIPTFNESLCLFGTFKLLGITQKNIVIYALEFQAKRGFIWITFGMNIHVVFTRVPVIITYGIHSSCMGTCFAALLKIKSIPGCYSN